MGREARSVLHRRMGGTLTRRGRVVRVRDAPSLAIAGRFGMRMARSYTCSVCVMGGGRRGRRYPREGMWPDEFGGRRAPNSRNETFAKVVRGLLAVTAGGILTIIVFVLIGLIWALLFS